MRILITNDDGIWAPGLLPLVKWAKKLGQVTVAAPKVEQSGKSHGIELRKAFEVEGGTGVGCGSLCSGFHAGRLCAVCPARASQTV